jgi:signal transduction histidine kinase
MSVQLAELEAEREHLRALANLSELGEVGRGLAHSLRNPLNTLGLAVDTLALEADPAAIAGLRLRAREQIRRIDEALKGFLALGAGLASVSEVVDVRVLIEDLLLEASQRADGRVGFQLTLPEQPLPLKVQAQELRAALQALLVNALEASPDGALVDIELCADGADRARLRIGDRGPGLPAHVRERLYTAHLSTKPDGAGMGLFLAHRILRERYGGQLELNDRDGGGTWALARFGARRDG